MRQCCEIQSSGVLEHKLYPWPYAYVLVYQNMGLLLGPRTAAAVVATTAAAAARARAGIAKAGATAADAAA